MSLSDQYRAAADLVEAVYLESERDNDLGDHMLLAATSIGKLLTMVRDLAAGLDSLRLARVTRPNGKLYAAQKPAQVIVLGEDPEEDSPIAVLRTHDASAAFALASLEHTIPNPDSFKLVWWSSHLRDAEDSFRVFYDDPEHGIPAVVFDA